ncbi:heme export protein [Renibacterium salmoninarum ATCC 33209]|uniref:Heme export protein n=1 Tax=Renibacterium salmoninarum (strain ATCC 33209 / DSM 20767 / JCM 11484 / NBRC 15589 / NCIMB 2235) TaxID=288705 RepID=A9WRZ9_RENSM|nr:cytochrome c biogenesis protein ResB [Renibacterium salmoninarum]ABY24431.1 heme export protein [Renibacterium salmoninarum ATCC 33209]
MGRALSSKKTEPSTEKTQDNVALPKLGLWGTLRWVWTQLTSMRTALFLLLLLAVAAVPGSLFPQRVQGASVVTKYIKDNPVSGPIMDWFKLFDVFSSPWFSAIYILLFISLIGCVVPRARQHYKAIRSVPPRTPARLSRLPEYGTLQIPAATGLNAQEAIEQAAAALKKRGYRVDIRAGERPSVGAERGFLKEVGNLLFHVSLIGVLVAVAVGGLFGFSYQRVLAVGDTFVNNLTSIDSFTKGTNFNPDWLKPFSVQLDSFNIQFDRNAASKKVQPLDFTAAVTVKDSPTAPAEKQELKVNEPIEIGSTSIYLLGNGYAPHFTVKDGNGNVAFSDWVVGKLQDPDYTSSLTIKAPDAKPDQLAFSGLFLPTAFKNADGLDISMDPDPGNPKVLLNSYFGDLGLDSGTPQNVFILDASKLTPLNDRKLPTGGISLTGGQTYQLPDGKGSITFDNLTRYIGIEVRDNPGQSYALVFAMTALLGLLVSLFLSRRRVWVRTGTHSDGRVMVEYGFLARGEDYRLAAESASLRTQLVKAWNISENSEQGNAASAEKTAAEAPGTKED